MASAVIGVVYLDGRQRTKEASNLGLLEPQALQDMLREAVRRRHIARLTEARERVAAAGIPPLTMEEIQTEIEADRAERSGKNDG